MTEQIKQMMLARLRAAQDSKQKQFLVDAETIDIIATLMANTPTDDTVAMLRGVLSFLYAQGADPRAAEFWQCLETIEPSRGVL